MGFNSISITSNLKTYDPSSSLLSVRLLLLEREVVWPFFFIYLFSFFLDFSLILLLPFFYILFPLQAFSLPLFSLAKTLKEHLASSFLCVVKSSRQIDDPYGETFREIGTILSHPSLHPSLNLSFPDLLLIFFLLLLIAESLS